MFKIKKTALNDFIEFLKEDFRVFAPVEEGNRSTFKQIESALEIDHSLCNTSTSPKDIYFPQAEILFQYNKEGIKVPEITEKPVAIWGLRNCDTKSFQMLDKVFGNAYQMPDKDMYKDPYWIQKYRDSIIFNQACNEPLSTCFCNWFEGGPFHKDGADVFVVDGGEFFFLDVTSEKGKNLLDKYKKAVPAEDKDMAVIDVIQKEAESCLAEKIDISGVRDKLNEIWDDPIWDEISNKCINCAACTFACSTCHCFDVSDEGKHGKGERIRLWDSCMFQLFTREASGHNPRGQSTQRVRQRIMHKYSYFMDNYQEYLCTGCGRCVQVCPVNLDIREVIKDVINYQGSADV
ncbi:4Fe-4S dicluster domain-containing protein [Candidatus Cloacimonadota bacterium]